MNFFHGVWGKKFTGLLYLFQSINPSQFNLSIRFELAFPQNYCNTALFRGRGTRSGVQESGQSKFVLPGGVHVIHSTENWCDDVESFVHAEFRDYGTFAPEGLPDDLRNPIAGLARLAHVNVFSGNFPPNASILFQRYFGVLQAGVSWCVNINKGWILKAPNSTIFVPVLRFTVYRDTYDPGSISSDYSTHDMSVGLDDGSARDDTNIGGSLGKAVAYFERLRKQEDLYVQKCGC